LTVKVLTSIKKDGSKMVEKKIRRYSHSFKLQVVSEYEAGASVAELRRKYGVKGSATIQTWVKKYARSAYRNKVVRIQKTEEYQALKKMQKHIAELETALSASVLENRMLKATIEVADEALQTDLKKNYARK